MIRHKLKSPLAGLFFPSKSLAYRGFMWYNDSIGGHDRHIRTKLLRMRQASPESVRYATDRTNEKVKFTDEALMTAQAVPCVLLPLVLKGFMDRAKEKNKK